MDILTTLYDDVFSILPISYSGITDFEVELNKFLQKLVESNFIKYNPNITLLFSAMLQFPEDKNKASQWELESLKKIFYKTFIEGDKRGVINFYFGLLNKFSIDKELGDDFSMTKTLSKFFIQPVDFKISLDENNDEPLVSFDRRNDVFNISLPKNILFFKLKHASRHKKINELFEINNLSNNIFTEFESRYEFRLTGKKTVTDLQPISNIYEAIFNNEEADGVANKIIEQLKYLDDQQNKQLKDFQLPKIFEKQDECCYKKIAYGAIAISFICYYYDSSLEYLLSIGNLKNENGTSKYQNLGGLVLGYNSKTKLSDYERTIFNIISDRLASVLVSQSLHKENLEFKYKMLRKEQFSILEQFHREVLAQYDIDHGNESINNKSIDLLDKFFITNTTEKLENCGLTLFEKYVKEVFKLGEKIEKGLFVITRNIACENIKKLSNVYSKLNQGSTLNINDGSVINIAFPHYLIKCFIENKSKDGKNYVIKIVTFPDENSSHLNIKVEFIVAIAFTDFINSITANNRTEGDLGQFFRNNYHAIRVLGNIKIFTAIQDDNGNDILGEELLCFEKDVTPEYKNSKVSKLNVIKNLTSGLIYNKLFYQIQYKSL